MSQYSIVTKAINFLANNPNATLEDIAKSVELSESHLQKTFVDWCGVSPKQFSRYLTLNYAKQLLSQNNSSNLSLALESGLSSTGRLHDLFVDIEAMTPGEYKNAGVGLIIKYSFQESLFGNYIVASTDKGICNVLFCETLEHGLSDLKSRWSNGTLVQKKDEHQKQIIEFFNLTHEKSLKNDKKRNKIKLHLHGTNFQLKVWEALLTIPEGHIKNYGTIAKELGGDNMMSRAVGTAIGDNPVGFIIPCHRVIQSTGAISGYRWGVERKRAILGWEASKNNQNDTSL